MTVICKEDLMTVLQHSHIENTQKSHFNIMASATEQIKAPCVG